MIRPLTILVLSTIGAAADAGDPREVRLWEKAAPGAKGDGEGHVPMMYAYPAPEGTANGCAVIVMPGGGYSVHAIDHEGVQVAEMLNRLGVTAFVLKYRLRPDGYTEHDAFVDGRRAITVVRERAEDFGIDPKRVGVLGFSAGGHLASALGVNWSEDRSDRPDFMVICYTDPAPLDERPGRDHGRKPVTRDTPPAFLWVTHQDDGRPVSTARFYQMLHEAGVDAELHVFGGWGPHGLGLAPGEPGVGQWPDLLKTWMRRKGYLTDKPRVEVTGRVTIDGQPLHRGFVSIVPIDDPHAPVATDYVTHQDDGKFEIAAGFGPVVGRHRVEVTRVAREFLKVPSMGDAERFTAEAEIQPGANDLTLAFESPVHGTGLMIGEVTPASAVVQIRLTGTDRLIDGDVPGAAGVVEFTLIPDGGVEPIVRRAKAEADHDFIARVAVTGLEPGKGYTVSTRIGRDEESLTAGPSARFATLAGAEGIKPVQFVVVTGMNYAKFHGDDRIDRELHVKQNNTALPPAYSGPDKHLGYPALKTILDLRPDFFVGTGDNVYYDTPTDPRARTIDEMRRKWHEQFIQPRYRDLFAAVPTYWEIDDHDYRYDDCDNSGDEAPSAELGRRVVLEQLPYGDGKTYRTHRVSRDLQIWLTENRWYRSPNAMPDGPEKSVWGPEQKEWLKRTLRESDATFKILISPTPMIGPDDLRKTDNHSDVGGFRHERDEFFSWLKESGIDRQGFYLVCGDRHWQYHSVDPSGIEEFSSGALVDANSRLGRKPGDPQSTDPRGEIKQPYTQDPASGGFLLVRVEPGGEGRGAQLTFRFHDERGRVLYEARKPSPAE